MLHFSANISLLFTEAPLLERLQRAKQCGFNAVELQFPYDVPADSLRDQLEAQQLRLVLFNVAADDLLQAGEGLAAVPEKKQAFQSALAQAVSYAKVLKPVAINVLPGRCLNPERYAEYLQTFKDNIALALAAFTPLGIKTVFEAINTHDMPGFIIHRQQQMLDILAALQHPALFMQYDIYHMQRMQENSISFIQQHAAKIGHIQFADNPGRGQPGTGTIDFQAVFKAIANSTYDGWVGAEYKPVGTTQDSLAWFAEHTKTR